MTKGERTREMILARAAALFNVHGVAGTSLSDVMAATGLEKGGIYNHFGSKEELARASFDYAADLVARRFADAWRQEGVTAVLAFVAAFRDYADAPPLAGGCPILNTAVESDDTDPILRDRTRQVVAEWRHQLAAAIAQGQRCGEISPEIDGEALASVIIATLEGGLMLAKLTGERRHLDWAADALHRQLTGSVHA